MCLASRGLHFHPENNIPSKSIPFKEQSPLGGVLGLLIATSGCGSDLREMEGSKRAQG